MAEPLGDHCQRHPGGQREARVPVPQIMQPHRPQARSGPRAGRTGGSRSQGEGLSVPTGEHSPGVVPGPAGPLRPPAGVAPAKAPSLAGRPNRAVPPSLGPHAAARTTNRPRGARPEKTREEPDSPAIPGGATRPGRPWRSTAVTKPARWIQGESTRPFRTVDPRRTVIGGRVVMRRSRGPVLCGDTAESQSCWRR